MSERVFNIGDVVQIKSGGPDMTVADTNMNNKGLVKCQWFGGRKLMNPLIFAGLEKA
jgi:uncharacterized protein YodC (DUF2158 family)